MNSQGQAIDRGSFYKHRLRDYTTRSVTSLKDTKIAFERLICFLKTQNATQKRTMIPCWQPTGWSPLGNYIPSLTSCLEKAPFSALPCVTSALNTEISTQVTSYFQQMHNAHAIEHHTETAQDIQLLKEMNTK